MSQKALEFRFRLTHQKITGETDGSFSSASTKDRLASLYTLLDDPKVSAILCARGAYGSAELLLELDFKKIAHSKKAIIGYSDVTALLAAIPKLSKVPAIHGATLTKEFAEASDSREAAQSAESVLSLLRGVVPAPLKGQSLKMGAAQGELVVGNLTGPSSLLGTPFEPEFKNSVLVIEEAGEAPYRVHRLLMQLKLAGKLDSLAALVFGRFYNCTSKNLPSLETTVENFLSEQLNSLGYPVLAGLELGHGGINLALPCGVAARVGNSQLESSG